MTELICLLLPNESDSFNFCSAPYFIPPLQWLYALHLRNHYTGKRADIDVPVCSRITAFNRDTPLKVGFQTGYCKLLISCLYANII